MTRNPNGVGPVVLAPRQHVSANKNSAHFLMASILTRTELSAEEWTKLWTKLNCWCGGRSPALAAAFLARIVLGCPGDEQRASGGRHCHITAAPTCK